jgi:hypothetical protein
VVELVGVHKPPTLAIRLWLPHLTQPFDHECNSGMMRRAVVVVVVAVVMMIKEEEKENKKKKDVVMEALM